MAQVTFMKEWVKPLYIGYLQALDYFLNAWILMIAETRKKWIFETCESIASAQHKLGDKPRSCFVNILIVGQSVPCLGR